MPADRALLVDPNGKLLIDANGQLADPACCCGCPPAGAPRHVSIHGTISGTMRSGGCAGEVEFAVSWDHTVERDLTTWTWPEPHEFSSCQTSFGAPGLASLVYECPEGCANDPSTIPIEIDFGLDVFAGTWTLNAIIEMAGCSCENFCRDGDSSFNTGFVDVGSDPIGAHTFTATNRNVTYTLVITIS